MTPFWASEYLAQYNNNLALITRCNNRQEKLNKNSVRFNLKKERQPQTLNDITITYCQLVEHIAKKKEALSFLTSKSLIMITAKNTLETIVTYLACLQLKHVVWFIDKELSNDKRHRLQKLYQVNLVVDDGNFNFLSENKVSLHEDLALVITTSGSTGTPNIVKLSYDNLNSNCRSICQVLPIVTDDNVITTLPLQYSFGLSIINTHLNMGSTIVLNEYSILQREFWQRSTAHNVTAFYGVPSIYLTLLKFKLARFDLENYRYFAIAGGKLPENQVIEVSQYCDEHNKQFYMMYGQTEATARITCLAPELVGNKPNAIGKAIKQGKLWLESEDKQVIQQANVVGELCYQGPNVMMGLAQTREDLAKPKEADKLNTGDLAFYDDDGDFIIVGRLKRVIKINGHRINLDEIENFLHKLNYRNACLGKDDNLRCFIESIINDNQVEELAQLKIKLSEQLNIHSSFCQVNIVDSLPILSSGKIDYQTLGTMK